MVIHGDRCLAPGTIRPAALPLTDGCPFRKSPLIMKLDLNGHMGKRHTLIRRLRHTAWATRSFSPSFLKTAGLRREHLHPPAGCFHLPTLRELLAGEGPLGSPPVPRDRLPPGSFTPGL